jgi:hypothetical protein
MDGAGEMVTNGFASLGMSLNNAWKNWGAWPLLAIVEYGSAYAQAMLATSVTNDPTYQRAIASIVRGGATAMSIELYDGFSGR